MSLDKDMVGFLLSKRLDLARAYADSGRKHVGLSIEALNGEWVASFRTMARDPKDWEKRAAHNDVDSEFTLRNLEPPYHLITEELEQHTSNVNALVAELREQDPDKIDEINEDLVSDLETFRKDAAKRN